MLLHDYCIVEAQHRHLTCHR